MPTPPKKLALQLAKLARQAEQETRQRSVLDDIATPKQRTFIEDPSKLKAALCTRQSGKTYGCGLYLVQECLSNPGCTCLFIGLTRGSAKQIIVRNILEDICKKLGLKAGDDYQFNKAELFFTFRNGSVIYIYGANADEEQREKLLGQKYRLIVIDECASFGTDLNDIVFNLLPAAATADGTICLIGTPGHGKNYFYRVTSGEYLATDVQGWTLHRWTQDDNPYTAAKQKAVIAKLIADNPRVVDTPRFRQYYMAEWTVDDSVLVYRYNPDTNLAQALPDLPKSESWQHVIGLDFGFQDDTAWVVVAYSPHQRELYVVHTYKRQHLAPSEVMEETQQLIAQYQPIALVCDTGGGGRQLAEDLTYRLRIQWEPAEKKDKYQAICMVNDDMIQGNVRLLPECTDLSDEWLNLTWDERELRKGVHKELKTKESPNHLSDAFLYAWRRATNYTVTPRQEGPEPGSVDAYWDRVLERNEVVKELPWFDHGTDGDITW